MTTIAPEAPTEILDAPAPAARPTPRAPTVPPKLPFWLRQPRKRPPRPPRPTPRDARWWVGVVWLVVFVVHLANGVGANWLDTWWPLVTGFAFVLLGAERLCRERRRP